MVTNFRRWLCKVGSHDAYMTRTLLGFDLRCRACGLMRYRDGCAEYDPAGMEERM